MINGRSAAMGKAPSHPLTVTGAAEMAGCVLVQEHAGAGELEIGGAAVDSRKVGPGDLFVALEGERTDGHRFLGDAVSRGASAVLVSRKFTEGEEGRRMISASHVPMLAAEDPLAALQRLGKAWVAEFSGLRRIAVTGSNGKTTTKELIASVLSRVGETIKNFGNLNSEIGLPQALVSVGPRHSFGVFEMGINHPGEMDLLTDIYRPEYTVITTIGTAHIGLLGSREAIAREKGKALAVLPPHGRAFIPETTSWDEYLSSLTSAPVIRYGERSTEGIEAVEDLGFEGWKIRYEGHDLRLPLMGRHNLENAIAAIHVGRFFGAEPADIAEGLADVDLPEGRSRVHRGEITIFEDSYNANIDSMKAVIGEMARRVEQEKLVLVLGAMKELGDETEGAHRELGELACRSGAKAVFLLGEETGWAETAMRDAGYGGVLVRSDEFETIREAVLETVRAGDTVLLKGSRLMELERLVEPLEAAACERSGAAGSRAAGPRSAGKAQRRG
jgi:UDP-N-acetylmuramoyl-tripeptide--D-alanyl-D-alanine ligase